MSHLGSENAENAIALVFGPSLLAFEL